MTEITSLLAQLATVPLARNQARIQSALAEVRELIGRGEEVLAFEALCRSFRKPDFPLTREHYRSVQQLGFHFGLPMSMWSSCYTADYFITRALKWQDSQGPEITSAEWRALVVSDPELSFSADGSGCVQWVGADTGDRGMLEWESAGIVAHEANDAFLRKLLFIASRLDAKVLDAEGKHYEMYDK